MIIKLYYQIVFVTPVQKEHWSQADIPECNRDCSTFPLITQFTGNWAFTTIAYSPHRKKKNYIPLKIVDYGVEGAATYWHEFTDCSY